MQMFFKFSLKNVFPLVLYYWDSIYFSLYALNHGDFWFSGNDG